MVKKLITAMIAIVIGLALLPVVAEFAASLTVDAVVDPPADAGIFNGTTVGSLIDLLPILYVIMLVAGSVGWVVISSKA